MAKSITVGIIGAGRIGKIHAENIRSFIPEARIQAVADVAVADKLGDWARGLGIEQVVKDPREILSDPRIEAVLICSSTDTHADLVMAAAAAGKHVFCEKPVDLTVDKVKRALAAVEKAGVKLQVGFNRRFDHNFRRVRELVQSGALGDPHVVRITSRDPTPPPAEYVKVSGGIFLDMTIHDFDMARYLAGSEVVEVYALGAVLIDPAIGKAGDVDTAVVTLTFAERRPRRDRQLPQGRLRLRPAGGGVRVEGLRHRRQRHALDRGGLGRAGRPGRQAALLLPGAVQAGVHRRDEGVLRGAGPGPAHPRDRDRWAEAHPHRAGREAVTGGAPPRPGFGDRELRRRSTHRGAWHSSVVTRMWSVPGL